MYASVETFADEYAPYNKMPAFRHGFEDYQTERWSEYRDFEAQAYERGRECAMRVEQVNYWVEQNVGLN